MTNYEKQKADFLDSLQPDDFRNGASFNQAGMIIENINRTALTKENPHEFLQKAMTTLFREGSVAVKKALELSQTFLRKNER